MFRKLNSLLRNLILIAAACGLLFKLTEKSANREPEMHESEVEDGFQTQEFDDIW